MSSEVPSVVIVGGGLQGCLLALALLDAQPDLALTLVEQADAVAGNHTWSFHRRDVSEAAWSWLEPAVARTWPRYDVQFPDRRRTVELGYASMTSARMRQAVAASMARSTSGRVVVGAACRILGPETVEVEGQGELRAELVIDARGTGSTAPPEGAGFQKFVGLDVVVAGGHGLEHPVLMDATVAQDDGFRFVYALPFDHESVLVEDTAFSSHGEIDADAMRERVHAWARTHFAGELSFVREERGVLPMPWRGEGPALQSEGPLVAGYRGRYFHPATGYSVPQAVRLAEVVRAQHARPGALFESEPYARLVREERKHTRFARFLNRLLFTGVDPAQRWGIFSRFYGAPEDRIARFYAGRSTWFDRTRMLVGRPPRGFSTSAVLGGEARA